MIRTKAEAFQWYNAGFFGNRTRTWPSLKALEDDPNGLRRNITLRYADPKGGGGPCIYDAPIERIPLDLAMLSGQGYDVRNVSYWEGTPDEAIVLQGEYHESPEPYLFFSRVKSKMRIALAQERHHLKGPAARLLLKTALDLPSWENLQMLLDVHPTSVFEISVWSRPVGNLRWNSVIWEVRDY